MNCPTCASAAWCLLRLQFGSLSTTVKRVLRCCWQAWQCRHSSHFISLRLTTPGWLDRAGHRSAALGCGETVLACTQRFISLHLTASHLVSPRITSSHHPWLTESGWAPQRSARLRRNSAGMHPKVHLTSSHLVSPRLTSSYHCWLTESGWAPQRSARLRRNSAGMHPKVHLTSSHFISLRLTTPG